MCITFIIYYPAQDLLGMPWMCPYGAPDDGSGCSSELKYGDLDSVGDLGRFGASSVESVATSTTDSSASGKCPILFV